MSKQIIKVQIKPKYMVIDYAIVEGEEVRNYSVEFILKQRMYHPDLRKALENLNQYLARVFYIPEYVDSVQIDTVELCGKEAERVKLSGKLALDSGNSVDIKSDAIIMNNPECPYKFEELLLDVNVFIAEVNHYLFDNKQAQQVLILDEKENNNDDSQKENEPDLFTTNKK